MQSMACSYWNFRKRRSSRIFILCNQILTPTDCQSACLKFLRVKRGSDPSVHPLRDQINWVSAKDGLLQLLEMKWLGRLSPDSS